MSSHYSLQCPKETPKLVHFRGFSPGGSHYLWVTVMALALGPGIRHQSTGSRPRPLPTMAMPALGYGCTAPSVEGGCLLTGIPVPVATLFQPAASSES